MAKKEKEAHSEIRQQLEDLLMGSEPLDDATVKQSPIANDGDSNPLGKVQHPDTKSMNFYDTKDGIEKEAKNLLKSVIEFYLDTKMIKKNDYVKYKKAVDEMSLSNIMFSLKTTQHAIIKILEEIDMGNMHPRIFEVLAQLQAQMMSVVKHQSALMLTIEEGYKKIKDDHDRVEYMKKKAEEQGLDDSKDLKLTEGMPLKIRGTKNLMLEIRNRAIDVPFEDVNNQQERSKLTDPHNRPGNPMEQGNEIVDRFEEEEGFNIDDEDIF